MAEKMDHFPEQGLRSRYPFDLWADGAVWKLTRGTGPDDDFVQALPAMRAALYAAARRRGMTVRTRSQRDGDQETLLVQFLPATEGRPDAPETPTPAPAPARAPNKAK